MTIADLKKDNIENRERLKALGQEELFHQFQATFVIESLLKLYPDDEVVLEIEETITAITNADTVEEQMELMGSFALSSGR